MILVYMCPVCAFTENVEEVYSHRKCKYCNVDLVKTHLKPDDKKYLDEKGWEKIRSIYIYPLGKYSEEARKKAESKIEEDYQQALHNLKKQSEHKLKAQANKPKCPTCGSTDIKKLDFIDRSVSIGLVGLASNKIGKSFQCKKCKGTW